jgi:radical SAM protein with 4Fe4S-binding SPASM domain
MDIHNLTPEEKIEQRKHHERLDFPYPYGISLGEFKCNLRCRMCPMYNMPPKEERYITDEVMERACRELGDRPCSLEISAYGETFLHPKADEYLFLARRLCPQATIVVATNGTLLNRERCEKIVDSGINHLSFSLDAGSPESYRWLNGSTLYDKVCKNLETLAEVRNKRGAKHLLITTHIIGIKELAHEFDSFIKRWNGIADSAVVRNYGNWAGLVDSNGITPAEAQNTPAERYPCAWLWYATKIEPNGDVSKCFVHVTGDTNPLGNIMTQSFESIWKGDRLRRLREMHLNNQYDEIELCGTCIVWSLFPKFWEREKLLGLIKRNKWL